MVRVMGACGPPGASRCSARLAAHSVRLTPHFGVDRTPSRPHPPLDGASPAVHLAHSETLRSKEWRCFANVPQETSQVVDLTSPRPLAVVCPRLVRSGSVSATRAFRAWQTRAARPQRGVGAG